MKVLDVGSGAGDVTFLASELVGPRGMVVGVEHDLTLLATLSGRVTFTLVPGQTIQPDPLHNLTISPGGKLEVIVKRRTM